MTPEGKPCGLLLVFTTFAQPNPKRPSFTNFTFNFTIFLSHYSLSGSRRQFLHRLKTKLNSILPFPPAIPPIKNFQCVSSHNPICSISNICRVSRSNRISTGPPIPQGGQSKSNEKLFDAEFACYGP